MSPNGAAVLQAGDLLAGARSVVGPLGVAIALSVLVVAVTVLLAGFVAPRLVDRLAGSGRPADDAADEEGETSDPVSATVRTVGLRTVQFVVLLTAGVSLLPVWGLDVGSLLALLASGESRPAALSFALTLVVLFLAYVCIEVLDDLVAGLSRRADPVSDHGEEIIRRVAQLSVLALAVATAFTVWGVDLSGLLVGAGFLGIVVGLAARQTLGSLIAGLVLMFSRPFTIGDWVEIGDQEGIVTDITIVNTRLENFDGEFVVIPNDTVGNQPITNRSRKGHLRIRLDVGVDYDSDPDHARDVALDAMGDLDAIEQTPPPQAFLKSFGDSAVVIELRFWIDRPTPPRMWQARSAVVQAVKAAFEAEGIEIPFPQRTLSGRSAGEAEVAAEAVGAPTAGPDGDGSDGRRPAEDS